MLPIETVPRGGAIRKPAAKTLACAASCCLALVASGCSMRDLGNAVAVQGGIPGTRADAEVRVSGEMAGYLAADVQTGGRTYRFLLPDTPACRSLRDGDREVAYAVNGRVGELQSGELVCEPAGVLGLADWRRKRGRIEGEGIVRASAHYEVIERADGVALARGRFPLYSRLGFSAAYDLIAVIPDTDECEDVLESDVASMEFRSSGKRPLTLISGAGPCELMGVVFVDPPLDAP